MRLTSRPTKKSSQSRTFTERRRKRRIWAASLIAACLLFWGIAAWAFVDASWFSIRTVTVYGADADIAATIQSAAETALQGKYMGILARSSTLIYPHDEIVKIAASSSPRIAGAVVAREGLHGLSVSVTQKTSSAIVCADLPDWNGAVLSVDAAANCSFADLSGRIFDQAPSFSGSAYNRYYIPSLDRSAGVGSRFAGLQEFYDGVRRAGIEPLGMLIGDDGEYELYVSNRGATSTAIVYVDDAGSLPDELSNLTAFWNVMAGKPSPGGASAFDYIDVRYAPNIFYRFAEGSAAATQPAAHKK